MSNPFNGSRKGKRGSGRLRITPRQYPSGHIASIEPSERIDNPTAAAGRRAHRWEVSNVRETVETHLIPRRPLQSDQMLGILRPDFEEVAMLGERHLVNPDTGEMSEIVYNPLNRPVTPRSLLLRGKPDQPKRGEYRETSRTKRRVWVPAAEQPDNGIDSISVVGGSELDDLIANAQKPAPAPEETFERCRICHRAKVVGKPCPFHPNTNAN